MDNRSQSSSNYIEDELEQYAFSSQKQSKERNREQFEEVYQVESFKKQKPPKKEGTRKKQKQEMNSIQEMQFKYVWNFLRSKQDSDVVSKADLIKAVQGVMKKPLEEEMIMEMLNIKNEAIYQEEENFQIQLNEYINEEDLREIFMDCNLKM